MRAFVIEENDQLICSVREWPLPTYDERDEHDDCDIVVRVDFSGVNFKDAMVASAPSRVRRVSALVAGVDAAGVVEHSSSHDVPIGTRVAVHGGDLGVGRDGGFASHVGAPARYLSALPESLSTREAMIIGTAGFTAMASVLALEDRGLSRGANVLVTGATGGVGSQAVAYLAARGYQPVASTGSTTEADWLLALGASRVMPATRSATDPDGPCRVSYGTVPSTAWVGRPSQRSCARCATGQPSPRADSSRAPSSQRPSIPSSRARSPSSASTQ